MNRGAVIRATAGIIADHGAAPRCRRRATWKALPRVPKPRAMRRHLSDMCTHVYHRTRGCVCSQANLRASRFVLTRAQQHPRSPRECANEAVFADRRACSSASLGRVGRSTSSTEAREERLRRAGGIGDRKLACEPAMVGSTRLNELYTACMGFPERRHCREQRQPLARSAEISMLRSSARRDLR